MTDSMYEKANEIFDQVMFADDELLALYNSDESGILRDELYEIIGEMMHEAKLAMVRVAEGSRERFELAVREHAA